MLMPPSSEHASHVVACNRDMPAQSSDYLTFFLPSITFPCTSYLTIPFTHKYPCSLAFEVVDLRLVLWSPPLAAL